MRCVNNGIASVIGGRHVQEFSINYETLVQNVCVCVSFGVCDCEYAD